MKFFSLGVCVSLVWVGSVCAQPERLSAREEAYADLLAERLVLSEVEVRAVQRGAGEGVGLRGSGFVLERLRFGAAEEARAFVEGLAPEAGIPRWAEARGAQVVLLSGARLGDGLFARRAQGLAWEVLPTPEGAPFTRDFSEEERGEGPVGMEDLVRHHLLGEELKRGAWNPRDLGSVDRRGTRIGSFSNGRSSTAVRLGDPVGRYRTWEEALDAARAHRGAEAVLAHPEGGFAVYDVTAGRRSPALDAVQTRTRRGGLFTSGQEHLETRAIVLSNGRVLGREGYASGRRFGDGDGYEPRWDAERAWEELRAGVGVGLNDTPRMIRAVAHLDPSERDAFERLVESETGRDLDAYLRDEMPDTSSQLRFGSADLARAILDASGPVLSEPELVHELRRAVDRWTAEGGALSDSSSGWSTVGLGRHLANHADTNPDGVVRAYTTGNEWALREAVVATRERLGRPLTVGEFFYEALRLEDGDVFRATLNGHNTLRALARGLSTVLHEQVPEERQFPQSRERSAWFGVQSEGEFFGANLASIRGGGDEPGAWYHLFGLMTMRLGSGSNVAGLAANVEEFYVSGDAADDPIELYINRLGIRGANYLHRP